jgi:iron complex outermembrane receptor protein
MFDIVQIAFRESPASHRLLGAAAALITLLSGTASAQQTGEAVPSVITQPTQAPASQPDPFRFRMPTVNVKAQKEPEDIQKIPVSVTAVSKDTIENADIHVVSEAAIFAPNTFFTELSARKLSNARFRGIGASPANPAITTYIDGVPQLNANTSSIELLDVDQIEFVRGPQSALFGRNTLGGLVNIASSRPSLANWTGTFSVPFGDHGSWAVRGGAAGPIIKDKVSLGVSFAQVERDGFTVNDVTGNDIDSRDAFSAKGQLMFIPNSDWETRLIFTGERARDGDYSLNDVAALRANPFHAARDFEGFTNRDIFGTTILAARTTGKVTFSSTTGFLNWKTQDVTDLDYTPFPIVNRDNSEDSFQFTQEARFASADSAPVRLGDNAALRWQSGVFLFTQNYDQDAVNMILAPFRFDSHSPRSDLDDFGLGLFGQGTVTFNDRLDLSVGARFDYENKSAVLETFSEPPIGPPTLVDEEDSFSNVSPQVSLAYRVQPDTTVYGTVGRGYKAGGFNPASPAGSESYDEEHTWNIEGGLKTLWANGRVSTNVAVYYIDWNDLQLNVPDPAVPAQFYISNVGGAASKGFEVELNARPAKGLDVFTSVGYTHARFSSGSISNGVDVAGNKIPLTPDYTITAGAQYTHVVGPATLTGRADAVFYGSFRYTDIDTLGQDAFSLVNFRVGATGSFLIGELVIRNAFNTEYIPIAFPYPNFAPSGYVGEMGAPRTVTFSAGVRF